MPLSTYNRKWNGVACSAVSHVTGFVKNRHVADRVNYIYRRFIFSGHEIAKSVFLHT